MIRSGFFGLLLAGAACTAEPDIVAIRSDAATAGQPSGGAGAGDGDGGAAGEAAELLPLVGAINGHDPSALWDGGKLWIVSGGAGVVIKTTTDLVNVEEVARIFEARPSWVADEVPDAQSIWSPEISHFGGLYHLYYAVSTLGSVRSCIGHATTELLDAASVWVDRGPLVCSKPGDDFNAIDPNVLVAADGKVWLVFGSYLTGIKLVQLDAAGDEIISEPIDVAARPDEGGALQAPALAHDGDFHYLFVSFNAEAAHRLVVGRASNIEGPYRDRAGRSLLEGGGDALFDESTRFRGAGSNDVFAIGERAYNLFHVYDDADAGRSKLRLSSLVWDADGWPVSAGP